MSRTLHHLLFDKKSWRRGKQIVVPFTARNEEEIHSRWKKGGEGKWGFRYQKGDERGWESFGGGLTLSGEERRNEERGGRVTACNGGGEERYVEWQLISSKGEGRDYHT